jgi:hypothetical protein
MPRAAAEKRRFALDQNFPAPVVGAFAALMPRVELVPIARIDPALAELADWELFVALHRREPRWDGLITNDDSLLALPKEMTVLSQTNLSLIVALGEGHSPIRAVGVLLCHLSHICHHILPDRSQIWTLRVSQKSPEEPSAFLEKIAAKRRMTVQALYDQHKLAPAELR